MSHEENKQDPNRPKRIAKIASDLSEFCDERQKFHANKAQDYGYSRDLFRDIANKIHQVPDSPLFFSAEVAFNKFHLFAKAKEQELSKVDFDVSSPAYSLGTSVVASSHITSAHGIQEWLKELSYPKPPPSWEPNRRESYAAKLDKIDPELGKLFRSVWQSFYGGTDNSERTALFCMRQLYDHFFEILAPDCKVINSPFFSVKDGEKPKQVYRRERIRYAANVQISIKALGETLETQVDHVLSLYAKLNKLHKRGELDRDECSNILTAMETIIAQWIVALNPVSGTSWCITSA